jgi:hypothetical protein
MLDNGAQAIIVGLTLAAPLTPGPSHERRSNGAPAGQVWKAPATGEYCSLGRRELTIQGERPLAYNPQMQYRIPDFKHTQQAANDTTMCIPMIETVEGLENCEEIASVPGVDAIFVGTHDLSDE